MAALLEFQPWEKVLLDGSGLTLESLILKTSYEFLRCGDEDVQDVFLRAIGAMRSMGLTQQAGWFLMDDSENLTEPFPTLLSESVASPSTRLMCTDLPWCFAQVRKGKSVLINNVADVLSESACDYEYLHESGVRSIALIPSGEFFFKNAVLILFSTKAEINWRPELVAHCVLLQTAFCDAYLRSCAAAKLKLSVSSLQRAFELSEIGTALLDNSNKLSWANPALHRMLGYTEGELCGIGLESVLASTSVAEQSAKKKRQRNETRAESSLIHKKHFLVPAHVIVEAMPHSPRRSDISLLWAEDLTRRNQLKRREVEIRALASQLIQSQETERKRLSRELHDDIGQRLSLAASEAAFLVSENATNGAPSEGRLMHISESLDQLCTDIHDLSHRLHSYKLQHLGLKVALEDLCQSMSQPLFHVDFHADVLKGPKVPDVALCLYRVTQEALNNASKHSHAAAAAVTLTQLQGMFYLTIQDAGVGFDQRESARGLGLLSMKERVVLIEGTFRVHSIPGRGTEIWVAVPDEVRNDVEGL